MLLLCPESESFFLMDWMGVTNMKDMSCELGEIFEEGSEICIADPKMSLKLCLRCSGGTWEPVDSEEPGSD